MYLDSRISIAPILRLALTRKKCGLRALRKTVRWFKRIRITGKLFDRLMAHRFRRIIPGIGKAEGLSAIRGFTRWVTCMYPISLVFDSLRKQTRTLRAKFEEA